jgi:hypothetical protein
MVWYYVLNLGQKKTVLLTAAVILLCIDFHFPFHRKMCILLLVLYHHPVIAGQMAIGWGVKLKIYSF